MPLIFQDRITGSMVREHPDWLFVFGDNLVGRRLGGQARECRDEPNALGIPTKRAPTMAEEAFLSDADLDLWSETTAASWRRIEEALLAGKMVVFPRNGLGTGLAQLPERAPAIYSALNSRVETLALIHGDDQQEGRRRGR